MRPWPRRKHLSAPSHAAPADPCAGDDAGAANVVLAVNQLSAGYNGTRTLHGVSFSITEGERVAVVGANGAGKSTLFKAVVGLLPHQGSISVYGASCSDSHTMVGYVPQHESVDWHFPATVWDVVMMGRARHIGYVLPPLRRDREAVRQALERVGLLDYRRRQLSELSGGQRRRVFVARALAQQASVLLLDEPFGGVDAAAEQEIFDVLDLLRAEGIAVLLATHNLSQAATHYDKVLLLAHGRVVAYGRPQEVYTPQALGDTFGDRIRLWRDGDEYIVVADKPCHDHVHGHDHAHDHHDHSESESVRR